MHYLLYLMPPLHPCTSCPSFAQRLQCPAYLAVFIVSPLLQHGEADHVLLGVGRQVPLHHVHAVVGEAEALAEHSPLQAQPVSQVAEPVVIQELCEIVCVIL